MPSPRTRGGKHTLANTFREREDVHTSTSSFFLGGQKRKSVRFCPPSHARAYIDTEQKKHPTHPAHLAREKYSTEVKLRARCAGCAGCFPGITYYIYLRSKNPDEIADFGLLIVERPLVIVERLLIFVERLLVIVERPLVIVERLLVIVERPLVIVERPLVIVERPLVHAKRLLKNS